jgi:thiamine-monophosphate kinase
MEGTHFLAVWAPAYTLGRKALSVNLSDIAAMGGRPLYYTVSLGVPRSWQVKQWEDLYRGLEDVGQETHVCLVGGNTFHCDRVSITVGLLGEASSNPVLRKGSRVGDAIYVTGTLGDSALGLEVLNSEGKKRPASRELIARHLDPQARVAEGMLLAEKRLATAMIDVSDGLLQDLGQLCAASSVGSVIDADSLPLSPAYRELSGGRLGYALSGGEDYELLFTVRRADERRLQLAFRRLGTPICRIGAVAGRSSGIRVVGGDGRKISYAHPGYDHFRQVRSRRARV